MDWLARFSAKTGIGIATRVYARRRFGIMIKRRLSDRSESGESDAASGHKRENDSKNAAGSK